MSGNTRRSSCIVKYVLSFHSYSCKSNFATLKLEELSSWSYSFAVRDLTIGNNYRVSWLNFLVWVRAQGQWARLLSQARTFPTHPLRFSILCTFNSELNCDLYMTIIPADRQEFDKNLTIVLVLNFQAVHSRKTDCELSYLLATTQATWHHSGFSQVGEVLFLVRESWNDLWSAWFGERPTCALDRTCPVIKVNIDCSSSLILLWFLTLCSFSTIFFSCPVPADDPVMTVVKDATESVAKLSGKKK